MKDASSEIWFVNRGMLVFRPKQPLIDWLRSADPEDPLLETWRWIREDARMLLELHLADWYVAPEVWPKRRDWKTLDEWCHLEYVDLVWDVVDGPLSSDAPEAEEWPGLPEN